ncbi:NACHT domain-containing protein [Streptomyces sp. NBC_01142]|uniref:NACHT domain-containing protein n=1 Tax=Streptomyces sp. NBC_01142 TaxID=2975865 RepID=UPI00224CAAAE|nr:NACHT domain-containing protein [Streptomyces sp. NBC_01142]MCX4825974.1 NACHT domain-containing protein [Streptomyces sp. NBC_01142]
MGDAEQHPFEELGARLRTLQLQRGLTQAGLRHRSGLGRTTISQALSGVKLPSEATVVTLARALRADVGPLLELRRKASPPDGRAARRPFASAGVASSFDERYLKYVAARHSRLTVVGLDLSRPDRACWPLDAAYLSLELAEADHGPGAFADDTPRPTVIHRAEQAMAGRQRILLKGLAGSGKTTLLQWLAVSGAKNELPADLAGLRDRVPFVLPLRTLVRRGPLPMPDEFLAAVGVPFAAQQPPGWADGMLTRGALVLVDGVDEVRQEDRSTTKEWLGTLVSAYPRTAFVVTTRPSAVPDGWLASLGFNELTVRPMSAADIGLFVGRWHHASRQGADDAEKAQLHKLEAQLRVTVRAERDVAQLATTPLLCALICALHRDRRGHLPHSRMELYEAALSMLLVRRDRERSVALTEGIRLTELQSMHLLQHLAYWLIRNQQTEMDLHTARRLIKDVLPAMPAVAEQGSPHEVLTHLVGRTGLLRQPTADTIDFVHRTFQDYLGAKAAVEALDFALLTRHAHDAQWEDVVRMAIAHARPVERARMLHELVTRGDEAEEHRARLHLLAAASLHYAPEVAPQAREIVTRRTTALMPPRSHKEAVDLIALGPGILDLLPRSAAGLEPDEIDAVIQTAAGIAGDPAYVYLQQFTNHLDQQNTSFQLAQGWSNFDADEYARHLLSRLNGKATLQVRTHAQRSALRHLTPVKRIMYWLSLTPEEIIEHLSAEHTVHLDIHDGRFSDLSFLKTLPALRTLYLRTCTDVTHLNGLAGLPLTSLHLGDVPDSFSFEGLADLPELTDLFLYTRLPWTNLNELPAPPHLKKLWLGSQIAASVPGVSRWQQLEDVVINHPLTTAEWEELADLPRLASLQGLRNINATRAMTAITRLQIYPGHDAPCLDLIPERFPRLESLMLDCHDDWSPNLAPLNEMPDVQITLTSPPPDFRLKGLPPERVTFTPRPRTINTSS